MALWEIVLAVRALKAQVDTLEAVLGAEMEASDAHWVRVEHERRLGEMVSTENRDPTRPEVLPF